MKKIYIISIICLLSISVFAQKNEIVFHFTTKNDNIFNKNDYGNLTASIYVTGIKVNELNQFIEKVLKEQNVVAFNLVSGPDKLGGYLFDTEFKKVSDLNFFYTLFTNLNVKNVDDGAEFIIELDSIED